MRLFGADNIKGVMDRLGLEEDQVIEHPLITRSIENAQKKVEARNFDIRKHVLEYDNVMNKQREVMYSQRRKVLENENLKENINEMIIEVIDNLLDIYVATAIHPEEWDFKGLSEQLVDIFQIEYTVEVGASENVIREDIRKAIIEKAQAAYEQKETELGNEIMRELERYIMLKIVDQKWMDHIDNMDQLREGIGLRAYGQRDPVQEYKFEGYEMFQEMIRSIQEDVLRYLFRVQVKAAPERQRKTYSMSYSHKDTAAENTTAKPKPVRKKKKIGRNAPCPCGSGLKYKKCCGRLV